MPRNLLLLLVLVVMVAAALTVTVAYEMSDWKPLGEGRSLIPMSIFVMVMAVALWALRRDR
jgi:hypothetical protein